MTPLSTPEKKMLRALNREHGTKYKAEQFMEWGTHKLTAQEGEKIYHVKYYGVNVAIKL
jgi:hypothetical protein